MPAWAPSSKSITEAAWLGKPAWEYKMSESHSESTGVEAEANGTQEAESTETDWKAQARKWEQRAKENLTAAKANEVAAQRLQEIEEANKTEAEKIAARAEAAEKRAAELEVKAIRAEVAAAKGVPVALLTGSTQEELEAAADALIEFRGEQKAAPSSSALGRVNGQKVKGSTADQFADFFAQKL